MWFRQCYPLDFWGEFDFKHCAWYLIYSVKTFDLRTTFASFPFHTSKHTIDYERQPLLKIKDLLKSLNQSPPRKNHPLTATPPTTYNPTTSSLHWTSGQSTNNVSRLVLTRKKLDLEFPIDFRIEVYGSKIRYGLSRKYLIWSSGLISQFYCTGQKSGMGSAASGQPSGLGSSESRPAWPVRLVGLGWTCWTWTTLQLSDPG